MSSITKVSSLYSSIQRASMNQVARACTTSQSQTVLERGRYQMNANRVKGSSGRPRLLQGFSFASDDTELLFHTLCLPPIVQVPTPSERQRTQLQLCCTRIIVLYCECITVCVSVCLYLSVCVCMYTCMDVYVCLCACVHVCACVCAHA